LTLSSCALSQTRSLFTKCETSKNSCNADLLNFTETSDNLQDVRFVWNVKWLNCPPRENLDRISRRVTPRSLFPSLSLILSHGSPMPRIGIARIDSLRLWSDRAMCDRQRINPTLIEVAMLVWIRHKPALKGLKSQCRHSHWENWFLAQESGFWVQAERRTPILVTNSGKRRNAKWETIECLSLRRDYPLAVNRGGNDYAFFEWTTLFKGIEHTIESRCPKCPPE
jgi:hypothetical protein